MQKSHLAQVLDGVAVTKRKLGVKGGGAVARASRGGGELSGRLLETTVGDGGREKEKEKKKKEKDAGGKVLLIK